MSRLLPWSRAADEAAWDALYEEHLPRVYNFLRYRVGPDAAEDLAASVFMKAWTKRARYRRELAAFGTWLFTIARNEAIDHLRKRRPHEPLEAASDVAATQATPEDQAERRADLVRLGQLLETLGERERELIALKYGAGLTNREIARVQKLGESHVGTLLQRTIEALRRAWTRGEPR